MVSAIKVGGRKLYELARAGEEVERAPRPVRIDALVVEDFEPGPYPEATMRVECSSGTYIRSLAADLGTALGGCAHLGDAAPAARRVVHPRRSARDRGDRGRPRRRRRSRPRARCATSNGARRRRAGARGRRTARRSRRARSSPDDAGDGPFAVVDDGGALLAVYERRGAGVKPAVVLATETPRPMKIYRDPTEDRAIAELAEPADGRSRSARSTACTSATKRCCGSCASSPARAACRATVLTFDRHPAEVVRPESAPKLLTTLDQKLELLEATGAVDECLVLTFDATRSKEPAEQFVEELLASALHARLVVVGADFHFGYRRHGDVPLLQRMGAELGFETIGLGLVAAAERERAADPPYSSTRVRELLAAGDVEGAAAMLGRPHEVRGPVEHGDGRGRELGFPTANVSVPERICLPADGVYAGTFVAADGVERVAALSIGRRPTFYAENGLFLLEAYVLDFDGDLYGQAAGALPPAPAGPGALRRASTTSSPRCTATSSRCGPPPTDPCGSLSGRSLRIDMPVIQRTKVFTRACPTRPPRSPSNKLHDSDTGRRRCRSRSSPSASAT